MAQNGNQPQTDHLNSKPDNELYLDGNKLLIRSRVDGGERPPMGRDGPHASSSQVPEEVEKVDSENAHPSDPAPVTYKQLETMLTSFRKKIAEDMDAKVKSIGTPVATMAQLPKNPNLKSVSTRKKTPKPKAKPDGGKVDWEKVLKSKSASNLPPRRNLILQQPANTYQDARD